MKCEKCLYRKNCQFIAKYYKVPTYVCECTAFESEDEFKARVKSEAITDFSERLKSTFPPRESEKCTLDDCYILDQIDTIMQEMIGDI